ncbi:hypothetical protein [Streptomyces chartreusis]|uniref:hypothetical protein n=1 Tax=Streptomyces chartreusis TaxID=1969 RepID=UPI003636641C
MFNVLSRGSSRRERELAWRAQLQIASRAPVANAASVARQLDPDVVVGQALYDSARVHETLMDLWAGLDARRPLKATAENALAAMSTLYVLRPSWIVHCDERFNLDPDAADEHSEMCRQFVAGDIVRDWRHFDQGRAALGTVTERLLELQSALADFCGSDLTARLRSA